MALAALPIDVSTRRSESGISTEAPNTGGRIDFVPESFEEMYRHYYAYVVKLVQTFGIDHQQAEDVAQTVLTKFFQKDALSNYNPEYTSSHKGVTRRAVFRTFLSGFVELYVRHYRERQHVNAYREGFSLDALVVVGSETGEPHTWMDYLGPRYYEEYEDLHEAELIRCIRVRLASYVPRKAQDRCDMPLFFEMVLQQTKEHGKIDTAELSELFEVSKTSIHSWLRRLRVEVETAVAEDGAA